MTKMIVIDGLEVFVTKKRIKRLNMRITDQDALIFVSAPYGMTYEYIADFVRSKRRWIDKNQKRILERNKMHPDPVSPAEKEERRKALKRRISERLPHIEDATGLRANGWTVRDMHTRWGSCNTSTHHLNFSLMLATRDDEELDYVILHELVHTIVPGHGQEFYDMMDRFMPGWKEVRKRLKY